MSRRNRLWHIAREAKTAQAYAGPEDDTDDEGGIDADPVDAPVCPWCDHQGFNLCQHADEARTCQR